MSIFVTEVFQFLSDFQSQNTKRIKKIIVLQMRAISGRTFIKQGTTGAKKCSLSQDLQLRNGLAP